MFDFLKKAFSVQPEPRPHHEVLAEEAEITGDDTRLTAEIIVKWAWDTHAQKPFIAPADEFVENLSPNGHRAISVLSPDEKSKMSIRQLLISEALDGIQKDGYLDAQMGQVLRHFSETGHIVKPQSASRKPSLV